MNRHDTHDSHAPPHVLLVEDDPTTRAYLQALTQALPARVDAAAGAAQALDAARTRQHALWLIDAHLPDGDGATLLLQLRALGHVAPAVAHTAARDRATLDALLAAGFDVVLSKPVDAAAWRDALLRALGTPADPNEAAHTVGSDDAATWDDAAAARALGGDPTHVSALRALFLAELPAQVDTVLAGDAVATQAQLHRLRASCALVGALWLDAAVRALQDANDDPDARRAFEAAARATLAQPPSPG